MIKFEEREGELFRMLDKPVPLTPDSKLPCLVRMIQDGTQMGKYNNDMNCWDTIKDMLWITRNIKGNPLFNKTLHAYEKDSNGQDSCIASIHQLEIIGYPVAEGSRWWALYQMMQGKKVSHKRAIGNVYLAINQDGNVQYYDTDNLAYIGRIRSKLEFGKKHTVNTGWQLYKEPEPKPLLADAQVGDLCRRRDGKWVQIDRLLSIGGMPWICYEIGGLRYINNGEQLNSKLSELGIISTEPLAPEGSAEWAWQMLMLGKTVYNPANYYTPSHGLINPNMLDNRSKQSFVDWQEPSGWQIYGPELEPPREPDYVICKRCGGTGYEIKPEPSPQYKVGDWVEYRLDGNIYYGKLCDIRGYVHYLSLTTEEIPKDQPRLIMFERIIRKLAPSQVVITIGCLKGTVEPVSTNGIHIWFHLIGVDPIAIIRISSLDTHTRELVESLLEAMQGEKK